MIPVNHAPHRTAPAVGACNNQSVEVEIIWPASVQRVLTFKNSIDFVKGKVPAVVLRNFFEPENGFVWSTSTWAEIVFSFTDGAYPKERGADLILDLDVFKAPPTLPTQSVKFYLNGLRLGSRDIVARTMAIVTFQAGLLRPTDNILTLDTPHAEVPKKFDIDDSRCLGVQLFSMQIRPG